MSNVQSDQEIAGRYDVKFQIESEIAKTEEEMRGDEQLIPAIGEAILRQLEIQLNEVQEKIDARWREAEVQGETFAVQGTFGFYWKCEVATTEVPF